MAEVMLEGGLQLLKGSLGPFALGALKALLPY